MSRTTTGSIRPIDSTFIWDINDFPNKCEKVGEYIESPYFQAGDISTDKIKFYLKLYPFGNNAESKDYLSLYLCCLFCTDDVTELRIFQTYSLWSENIIMQSNFKYSEVNFNKKSKSLGYPKFLLRTGDELKNHLSLSEDSTLSIRLTITNLYCIDVYNDYEEMKTRFTTFFLDENLSDLIIEVENKQLKAHKILLAASSEVFSAMLKHDMKESNENIIKIEDISYNVMIEILRYIYCGEVEELDLFNKELLIAADKYNLASLKTICEQSLWKNLNANNVCDILSLSNLCDCVELKKVAIKFIIKNLNILVDTEEFKKLSEDSKLCCELFKDISLKLIK